MKKRIPALLLSGVLSLSMLSTAVFAADLTLNDDGTLTGGTFEEGLYTLVIDDGFDSMIDIGADGSINATAQEKIKNATSAAIVVDGERWPIKTAEEPPAAEKYTIKFEAGEGSGTMDDDEINKEETGDTTYTIPTSTFTAPEGKVFDAWTVSGSGLSVSGSTLTIAEDVAGGTTITLTATWKDGSEEPTEETYTIKFNPNGGSGEMPDRTVVKAKEGETTWTIPANTFTAPSGKVFDKWTVTSTGVSINGDTLTIESTVAAGTEITLTANWKDSGSTTPGGDDNNNNNNQSGGSSSSGTSGTSSPAIKPLPDRNQGTTTPANPSDNPGDTTPAFFNDVPANYWAAGAIEWVSENGFMQGINETTFNPEGNITRQQMWMIMSRMASSSAADMAAARTWAMGRNLTDGTNPAGSMTRQQLVTYLYRFAQRQGFTLSGSSPLTTFPDNANVASYAQTPLSWAVANGIIAGKNDGRLDPTGTATRAQFATILQRFYTNIVNKNA